MEGCQKKQNKVEQFDPDFIIPIVILHSLSSICATLLNAVVLLAIWKTPSLRTPSRILLCSLAVSDFCMGFLTQPLFVVYCVAALQKWTDIFCSIWVVNTRLGYCLAGLSFGTLTFISMDRYLAIKTKMLYRSLVTLKRVSWLVLCGWVLCIASISLAIQYFPFRVCLLIGSILIVIGLLIIIVSYSLSFLALKNLSEKVSCPATDSTAQNNLLLMNQSVSFKLRTSTDQSTSRKPTESGIQSAFTIHQENELPTHTQAKVAIKLTSINQTPSNDILVYQENQSALEEERNQKSKSDVSENKQSETRNQDKQSAWATQEENQSESVKEDNQSVSVSEKNQSASVNQHSESASLAQEKHSALVTRKNQSASVNQDIRSTSSSLYQPSTNFNVLKYKRSLITMLMLLALTIVAYLPLICHTLLTSSITMNNSIVFSHFSQFIVAFNSTVNPLFYIWRMKDLRIATIDAIRSMISKVRCR